MNICRCDDSLQSSQALLIRGIKVINNGNDIILEWEGNYCDDVIAMAIDNTIKELGSGIKTLRMSKISKDEECVEFLRNYFEKVELVENTILVNDTSKIEDGVVTGPDSALNKQVTRIFDNFNKIYHKH